MANQNEAATRLAALIDRKARRLGISGMVIVTRSMYGVRHSILFTIVW